MRRLSGWVLLLVVVNPTTAAEPKDQLVKEFWDAAYLEGNNKIGYFHTTVREVERDGAKFLRSVVELNFTIKRGQDVMQLRMETGTEETTDGKVTAVSMRQFQGKDLQLVLTGIVQDKQLVVKVDDGRIQKRIPWNDQVIGLYGQDRIYQQRKVKPGDQIIYLTYEPMINSVVTVRATVKEEEEVEVFKVKKRLLRVEAVSDKIGSFQPPPLTLWLDKDLRPVRSEMDFPPFGKVVLYRTTREVATGPNGILKDLLLNQLIPLNQAIPRPHSTKKVVYRITIKDDPDPATAFAQDARQEIRSLKGQTFEMHVRSIREPQDKPNPGEPKPEFLKSCYYLNCDDAKIKENARQAVGKEKDPLAKARLIEKWVHNKMKHSNSVGFITADQIARNPEGDCRQHAMLAAAMCRAAEVPSRTAVGLIYVDDPRRGPVLGFHMWLEVWIKGQWIALDPTLGQGSVGAGHIKIADHSWYDTTTQTPLLPVARVLGKVSVEVVSVNGED
jgi:transglutaminase-like putative cysteine protease